MAKIEHNLSKPSDPEPPSANEKKERKKLDLIGIDIAMIGACAFNRHLRDKDSQVFMTSLYEIDQIIESKKAEVPAEEAAELRQQVPECYHEYLDVFSKTASDTLPPPRPYDHKIELDSEMTLGYSPLYKMSLEELEAAKEYILENLAKGFIVNSHSPFASPILMAQKPGGG